MSHMRIKPAARLFILFAIIGVALVPFSTAKASEPPELPAGCSSINVEAGNKLAFHAYARGVQIYRWNGSSWDFVAPRAELFAEKNFFGEIGSHYAGPKWESKSGSIVEARRVTGTGCTPDATAIAWILLAKINSSGPGIFANVTFIQRVNTTGGIAPAAPGLNPGEVKEVEYTAEYYFYKKED